MRKRVIVILVIVLVIFSPLIFLSTCSLNLVQSYIDNNKDKSWAPSWQLSLAGIFRNTFREKRAGELYKIFMERYPYPKEPRYADAKFYYANCISKDKDRREDAIKEFTEFIDWFPKHPLIPDAEKKMRNLKWGVF